MDSLIEHIDAVQKLQMPARIRFKIRKGLACGRIVGVYSVNMRLLIHFRKPLRRFPDHFRHMFVVRAEDNIFPCRILHMLSKDLIQPVYLLKGMPQSIQLPFSFITDCLILRHPQPLLVLCQILLIREYRQDILGRIQDPPHDRLAKGHLRSHISIE